MTEQGSVMRVYRRVAVSLTVLVGAACLVCGCQSVNFHAVKSAIPFMGKDEFPKADDKNPVARVIGVWETADGPGLDQRTVRGFSGHIFFITPRIKSPVTVDGAVRIYLFDDQGSREEMSKPLHQFDYTGEAWATHLGPSSYGPTYQVFIPYTRPGMHKANCALQIRYTCTDGRVVTGEMANIVLPGQDAKAMKQAQSGNREPQFSSSLANNGQAKEPTDDRAATAKPSWDSPGLVAESRQRMREAKAASSAARQAQHVAQPDASAVNTSEVAYNDRIRQLEQSVQKMSESLARQNGGSAAPDMSPKPSTVAPTERRRFRPQLPDSDRAVVNAVAEGTIGEQGPTANPWDEAPRVEADASGRTSPSDAAAAPQNWRAWMQQEAGDDTHDFVESIRQSRAELPAESIHPFASTPATGSAARPVTSAQGTRDNQQARRESFEPPSQQPAAGEQYSTQWWPSASSSAPESDDWAQQGSGTGTDEYSKSGAYESSDAMRPASLQWISKDKAVLLR